MIAHDSVTPGLRAFWPSTELGINVAHIHTKHPQLQKLKEDKCCTWFLGLAFWLTLVWKLSKSWTQSKTTQTQWDKGKQGPGKGREKNDYKHCNINNSNVSIYGRAGLTLTKAVHPSKFCLPCKAFCERSDGVPQDLQIALVSVAVAVSLPSQTIPESGPRLCLSLLADLLTQKEPN